MGRWTYYSPLWLGAALSLVIMLTYRQFLPELSDWLLALVVAGACVLIGLVCQLVIVAVQGAFAQVLPVPGGRSVRGRGAVVCGWLLMAAIACGVVAGALWIEEGMWLASLVLAVLGLGLLCGAVITYLWCWPLAVRDFAEER